MIGRRRFGAWTALAAAVLAAGAMPSCAKPKTADDTVMAGDRTPLTSGMVKRTIVKGKTTQTEVLEVFGPPDIETHDNGRDVWTYEKVTAEVEDKGSYWTVIFVGGDSNKVTSSSRTSMVIVYFDDKEVVRDYRLSIVRY